MPNDFFFFPIPEAGFFRPGLRSSERSLRVAWPRVYVRLRALRSPPGMGCPQGRRISLRRRQDSILRRGAQAVLTPATYFYRCHGRQAIAVQASTGRRATFDTRFSAGLYLIRTAVPVAQSAERQIVALEVVGSNPIGHPHIRDEAPCAETLGWWGFVVSSMSAPAAPPAARSNDSRSAA